MTEFEIKELSFNGLEIVADGLEYELGCCLDLDDIEDLKKLSNIIQHYLVSNIRH